MYKMQHLNGRRSFDDWLESSAAVESRNKSLMVK